VIDAANPLGCQITGATPGHQRGLRAWMGMGLTGALDMGSTELAPNPVPVLTHPCQIR
jgi:hypothetical protein